MIINNKTRFHFDFTYWHKVALMFGVTDDTVVNLVYRTPENDFEGVEGYYDDAEHIITVYFDKNKRAKEYKMFKEYVFFHELRHDIQLGIQNLIGRLEDNMFNRFILKLGKQYKGTHTVKYKKMYNEFGSLFPREADADTFAELMLYLKPVLNKFTKKELRSILRGHPYRCISRG